VSGQGSRSWRPRSLPQAPHPSPQRSHAPLTETRGSDGVALRVIPEHAQATWFTLDAVTSPDFETYRKSLSGHGFHEVDSGYNEAVFGTWFIVFDNHRTRVIWEGKEQWLTVQRATFRGWADVWIGREEATQTPDAVAAQLALLR